MSDPSDINPPSLLGRLPADVFARPDVVKAVLIDFDHRLERMESLTPSASQGPGIAFSKVTSGRISTGGISYVRLMILVGLFGVASGKLEFLIKRIAASLG